MRGRGFNVPCLGGHGGINGAGTIYFILFYFKLGYKIFGTLFLEISIISIPKLY